MKEKKKDGEGGGRPRGRKNIIGSESQGLLQAAAGSGFIGFSAFQTPAKATATGVAEGTGAVGSAGVDKGLAAGGGNIGKRRHKTTKQGGGSPGQALPPHYSGSNSHLAVVSKRLSKRDAITKLKALSELQAICRLVTDAADASSDRPAGSPAGAGGGAAAAATATATATATPLIGSAGGGSPEVGALPTSAEDLGGMAPHWVFLYQRLSAEGDRRTREAANTTLLCMLKANRRAFQPLMRSLMGPWWCSQADTANEVATSAKDAFDAVFPELKRASVLRRCAGAVLNHIGSTLQQTPEMLEEASGCTPEEAVKRAERLVVSALSGLSNFLEAVGEETNNALCVPGDHDAAAGSEDTHTRPETTYLDVVNESLWACLEDSRPAVRRATYALVSACCRHAPALLRPPHPSIATSPDDPVDAGTVAPEVRIESLPAGGKKGKEKGKRRSAQGIGGKRSRVATPTLLVRLLSEKEVSNHREAWQAVLLVMREFKHTWTEEKGATAVLPTLLARLRSGDFLATSGISYPCLLPLIASLPMETLLAPADGRAGKPLGVAMIETLWATVTRPPAGGGGGGKDTSGVGDHRGAGESSSSSSSAAAAAAWLADVVSAHVECATFLLLKLPPPPSPVREGASVGKKDVDEGEDRLAVATTSGETIAAAAAAAGGGGGGGGDDDSGTERDRVAFSVSAATASLAEAVRSFVLDDDGGETAPAVAAVAGGGGRGDAARRIRGDRKKGSHVIRQAFGHAFGQLHMGAEKRAGVMSSASGSAAVWGALLAEFKEALDQRSRNGAVWMGNTLSLALATVQERQSSDGAGVGSETDRTAHAPSSSSCSPLSPSPSGGVPGGGGLRGVCRVLFHHCVGAIAGGSTEEGARRKELSPRDVPLLGFLARMTRLLGIKGIFQMRSSEVLTSGDGDKDGDGSDRAKMGVADNSSGGGGGSSQTMMTGLSSRRAATEFYENFLVPRLVASAVEGSGPSDGMSASGTDALKAIAASFLFAEDDSRQVGDFRQLLGAALSGSGSGSGSSSSSSWLRTTAAVLGLAPPGMTRDFPEIDRAVLTVCGLSAPAGGPISSPPGTSNPKSAARDLPALLEACLGVVGGRAMVAPFVKASTASDIVKVATGRSAADVGCAADADASLIQAAALEGCLGVLLAAEGNTTAVVDDRRSGNSGAGGGDDDALVAIRMEVLPLLLATFSGLGKSSAANRLWRDRGAPVLESLVAADGEESSSEAAGGEETRPSRRRWCGDVWQTFSDGAVDCTRRAMEGSHGDKREGEAPDWVPPPQEEAERAATLTSALVDIEKAMQLRHRRQQGCGERASREDVPVLWRLGLTRPSVWRERRLEAVARVRAERGSGGATASEFARACVGSRWARRHECVSLMLSRLPDVRERLSLLMQGAATIPDSEAEASKEGEDAAEVAGAVLQEIVTAGVVLCRAEGLRRGTAIGGMAIDDDVADDAVSVDLPSCLLLPCEVSATSGGSSGVVRAGTGVSGGGGGGGVVDQAQEFGLGLPSFRGIPPAADGYQPVAIAAAAASAEVLDAAMAHFDGDQLSAFRSISAARPRAVEQQQQQHPFSLLLPQGLWRVAFESTAPGLPADDVRLHGVLVSALHASAKAMAEVAAVLRGEKGGASEAEVWRASCAAEVSMGLLVSAVGEAFVHGLGLGDDAKRLMAARCGVLLHASPPPSAADLVPGAKTLYLPDGQAVTIVAAHVDPGGGEGYYTVRPVSVPGSATGDPSDVPGRERQTVLDRLSVLPPLANGRPGLTSCPSLLRSSVSAKLGAILGGPLLVVEQILWEFRGRGVRASGGSEERALASATAAALRGLASTCVRATLLCAANLAAEAAGGDDGKAWEGVRSSVLSLRNRWASAAVKSGSAVLTAAAGVGGGGGGGGGGGEGGSLHATATLALSTAVLSGFLAATPLMPSGEDGMRLMPTRLRGALCAEAEAEAEAEARAEGVASAAALGWRRSQGVGSLTWLRDCAEASCKVHVSPYPGSLGSESFVDVQANTEAAVMALAGGAFSPLAGRGQRRRRRDSDAVAGGWGSSAADLALARACAGLFAGESLRLSRGHEASLSSQSKAAVVSWAVSKFLLSGGRMSSTARRANGGSVSPKDDGAALCLETARLLTATAWDGRRGWGRGGAGGSGGGGVVHAPPQHRLVARADRAKVWEAARAPAVWRGLHAAVVGAVASPVLQMCAFEVLEAAASDWTNDALPASPDVDADGDGGAEAKDESEAGTRGEHRDGEDGVSEADGRSIVTRLASALGGWGLASSAQQREGKGRAGATGGEGVGVDEEASGGRGEGGDRIGLSAPKVGEEEAKEQQDDLELIARCFPEDLLLAVEALPSTIAALAEDPEASESGALRGGDAGGIGTDGHEEENEEDDEGEQGDDEGEQEEEEEEEAAREDAVVLEMAEPGEGGEGLGDSTGRRNEGSSSKDASERATAASDSETSQGVDDLDAESNHAPHHSGGGKKSRRKRLQHRRSIGSNSTQSAAAAAGARGTGGDATGRGRDRRIPATGPSLTAPFLTWLLWLEHCRRASELESKSRASARAFVVRSGSLAPVLEACFRVLRASQDGVGRSKSAASRLGAAQAVRVSRLDPRKPHDLARLALAVYFRTVHVFPALSRSWWADDCARGQRVWVAEFTKRHVSPALIQIEAQIIANATEKGLWDDDGEMSVRASAHSRQVVASYLKEECTLEAVIQLPPEYPLRNVEVTCSKRMGVSESRWRQWVLQIVTLLSLQDGSVLDAVMMWKKNVDKEFEGVEPCVICYSVLHPKSMDLPQMTCKTCNNRFHSSCLYKWFHTSHKNKCPICQQIWI